MRRLIRLLLAAGLAGLLLSPSAAHAASSVVVNFFGLEYAATSSCGSFAGPASANGQQAFFNTVVCHSALGDTTGATATINRGGSFAVYTRGSALTGSYVSGRVGPGVISQFGAFCAERFPVTATLSDGSGTAVLTHFGLFSIDAQGNEHCTAFAAKLTGQAVLTPAA